MASIPVHLGATSVVGMALLMLTAVACASTPRLLGKSKSSEIVLAAVRTNAWAHSPVLEVPPFVLYGDGTAIYTRGKQYLTAKLYPDYSAPGWWCWEIMGPEGRVSQCLKGKRHCEWNLHDTESKLGLPKKGECSSQVDVTCFSKKMDGVLDYQCAMTEKDCNFILERQTAMASSTPVEMTNFSVCRPWAFGADNDARMVPRPKKNWKPADTLVFEVADDNADPVRTVRLMRDRTNMRGVAETEVVLRDREIIVHLPDLDAEEKARVVELLIREGSWTAHRVATNKALMEAIATWTGSAPEAEKLGIRVAMDADGSPYLLAVDRKMLLVSVDSSVT